MLSKIHLHLTQRTIFFSPHLLNFSFLFCTDVACFCKQQSGPAWVEYGPLGSSHVTAEIAAHYLGTPLYSQARNSRVVADSHALEA